MPESSPEIQEMLQQLEQLALRVVMLEADDVQGQGAVLSLLEELQSRLDAERLPELAPILGQMTEVGQKLILQNLEDTAKALELLGQGVAVLQRWAREAQWPPQGEAWEAYCRLVQELGLGEPGPAPPGPASEPDPGLAFEDPELVANFISEARDHLEGIENLLVHLEQNPDDLETVNAIFRPFHTLKGVAGFLNLTQIQEVGHEVEWLLERVRGGQVRVCRDLVDVVLEGVDLLRGMLADLQLSLAEGKAPKVFDLAPLKAHIAKVNTEESEAAPAAPASGDKEEAETSGDKDAARPAGPPREADPPSPEAAPQPPRKDSEKKGAASGLRPAEVRPLPDASISETVKVDIAKVDNLVDLMGELVIVQSQVRQNQAIAGLADQKLERDLAQMARITSELQKISMSLRMVPISGAFRKMVRLVRDLSHKMGKQVHLYLEGEDTEIDRSMVEALYDPLVHLVRNAVDHGLEKPEERKAQGKHPVGRLWLRAFHQGGDIIIEIEDDGRGLNREAILARAVERGLVPPGENLSPERIDQIIFEPGFSTAQNVTEVSGRGVGLDVVKEVITRLRGKIDLSSRPGEGSRFHLRLPLTLAIIDGLVVRVGQERYILPTVGVQETLKPAPQDYFTVKGKGELIRVRQHLIPLMRLHRLFGMGNGDVHPSEALVMVVEHEGERRALLVDDILGKQEIVIKSLGPLFQKMKGLAGGTILGDGRVGLILDIAGLFQLEQA